MPDSSLSLYLLELLSLIQSKHTARNRCWSHRRVLEQPAIVPAPAGLSIFCIILIWTFLIPRRSCLLTSLPCRHCIIVASCYVVAPCDLQISKRDHKESGMLCDRSSHTVRNTLRLAVEGPTGESATKRPKTTPLHAWTTTYCDCC